MNLSDYINQINAAQQAGYQNMYQWPGILGQTAGDTIYPSQVIKLSSKPDCLICGKSGCMEAHQIKPKENWTMFKSMRAYVEKHSDVLWTVATVVLLDHFLFEGKFRLKIEEIMESLISKASEKVKQIEGEA